MSIDHNQKSRLRTLTTIQAFFVVAICLVIAGLSVANEWLSRDVDLRNAEIEMANLANSLTRQAEDTFELASASLQDLVERLEQDGAGSRAIARLDKLLKARKRTLGRIRGLFVYDDGGRWLATSENVDFSGLNNSDRLYFAHHRESADRGSHIGAPVRSRSGGQWILTVSRRFDRPDGGFGGVVLATIDVSYFSDFYRQFEIGPHGAISLLSRAGILLARSVDELTYVGRDLSASPIFEGPAAKTSGTLKFLSPLDGEERISSYNFSNVYPIAVVATKAQRDVLSRWQSEAIARFAFVFLLIASIAVVGFYLTRQARLRQRMMAALLEHEADFRLLAEESSDMVMRIDGDGIVRYASPSSVRLVGWSSRQLIGTPSLAAISEGDRAHVDEAVEALRSGRTDEAKIIYRTRHRDGREIWLETALRSTRNRRTGGIDGVVAISRDMTEHVGIEQQLAALATTDGLTGIPNRRSFDQRLQQEWTRMTDRGGCLSLLLIDVDFFKSYNDRYGHQKGDDCLRRVGVMLASQAKLKNVFAARYGGEEFVMLLPEADSDRCFEIAESLRRSLLELEIPHDTGDPTGLVTVSVGGATAFPSDRSPERLLAAADRALYRAKQSGRNRSVTASASSERPSSFPEDRMSVPAA